MSDTGAGEGLVATSPVDLIDPALAVAWVRDLYALNSSARLTRDARGVRDAMLGYAVRHTGADFGWLAWRTRKGRALRVTAAAGVRAAAVGVETRIGEGLLGQVAATGRPVHRNADAAGADLPVSGLPPELTVGTAGSIMAWPLLVGGRPLGVLCVARACARPHFTAAEFARGEAYAGFVTPVIDSVELHQDRDLQLADLARKNAEIVEANRRLAEADARRHESERHLETILGSLEDIVWSTSPDLREVLYVNPAFEKVYGRPAAEFRADPGILLAAVHPEDRERVEAAQKALVALGSHDMEYRIVRPNGRVRWIRDRAYVIYGDDGWPSRIDGIGTDVTGQKEDQDILEANLRNLTGAYQKLKQTQEQLLHAEKMASIGQLAAGVAHEINNPVGYINSNINSLHRYVPDLLRVVRAYEGLEAEVPAGSPALAQVRDLKREVDIEYLADDIVALLRESEEGLARVRQIVQDLKEFSHVNEEGWQFADLHRCLDSTFNIVRNEVKYKAEVVRNYGTLPPVECQASQLNQVFMNLLVNAAQAIEGSGTITVSTGTVGDRVWVEIADTGRGIAPEQIARIFDPFFTTKPVGQGTGLGLSISYGIVKKHAGGITVESEPGRGTRFRVELPQKRPETLPAPDVEAVFASELEPETWT